MIDLQCWSHQLKQAWWVKVYLERPFCINSFDDIHYVLLAVLQNVNSSLPPKSHQLNIFPWCWQMTVPGTFNLSNTFGREDFSFAAVLTNWQVEGFKELLVCTLVQFIRIKVAFRFVEIKQGPSV